MPGFGPRAEPGAEAGQTMSDADRDAAAKVGTWAAQQAYKLGAEQALDPQAGYRMGHDVGLFADNDARHVAHVGAVLEGWADGNAARHEAYAEMRDQERQASAGAAHARLETRAAETQPEAEAEAG